MSELINILSLVVPIALVASINPTAFTVMIVLLSLSERPKISGLGFFIGSLIIILVAALLGLLAVEGAYLAAGTKLNLLPGWIDIILGTIMLYFGIKTLFKKDYGSDKQNVENLIKGRNNALGFYSSALLALGLFSLNLITTVLVFLASNQIAMSDVNWMGKSISLILLLAITLLLIEIPLIIVFFVPKKADNILSRLNKWIQKNGQYLTAGLIITIGLYFLFNGLKELDLI